MGTLRIATKNELCAGARLKSFCNIGGELFDAQIDAFAILIGLTSTDEGSYSMKGVSYGYGGIWCSADMSTAKFVKVGAKT